MGQTLSEPVTEKFSGCGGDERVIYGLSSMQGWRISMEDAHAAILKLEAAEPASFFAVFDGHGGASTAKFAGKALHKRLESEQAFKNRDYRLALKQAFLGADMDLKNDPEFKHDPSGCTAVAVIITDDHIYCGNAGDSRAVMSVAGTAEALSHDHKPTNLVESQRIVNAGGFVEFGRVNGNLALSRALGDFEFKKNASLSAEEQIVTSDPEIIDHVKTPEDEFVVIACDGIWDCMSSQEVIAAVRQGIANKTPLDQICERIMDECLADDAEAGSYGCDNMTIIVIGLLNGRTRDEWYEWVGGCHRASAAVSGESFSSVASPLAPASAGVDVAVPGGDGNQEQHQTAGVRNELEMEVDTDPPFVYTLENGSGPKFDSVSGSTAAAMQLSEKPADSRT